MTTPDGPFWDLVKAEFRATWCGRWRWLWWGLFVASAGLEYWRLGSGPTVDFGNPWRLAGGWFLTVGCLGLGADLLSLRFSTNPEPHREWPFRAISARAVGRFGPLAALALLAALSRLKGASSIDPDWAFYPRAAVLAEVSCLALDPIVVFLLAALVGAGFRRPRRLVAASGLLLLLLAVDFALLPAPETLPVYAATPLWIIRTGIFIELWKSVGREGGMLLPATPPHWMHSLHPLMDLIAVAICCGVLAAIVAGRCRRHPYTAGMGLGSLDGDSPA